MCVGPTREIMRSTVEEVRLRLRSLLKTRATRSHDMLFRYVVQKDSGLVYRPRQRLMINTGKYSETNRPISNRLARQNPTEYKTLRATRASHEHVHSAIVLSQGYQITASLSCVLLEASDAHNRSKAARAQLNQYFALSDGLQIRSIHSRCTDFACQWCHSCLSLGAKLCTMTRSEQHHSKNTPRTLSLDFTP
jgi:hypothetical protein